MRAFLFDFKEKMDGSIKICTDISGISGRSFAISATYAMSFFYMNTQHKHPIVSDKLVIRWIFVGYLFDIIGTTT
jgi:hypothetical protein